jgi:hypothetical protein
MTRMRRAQPDAILPLALSLALLQPALADTYGAARTDLVAAYEAKDYPAMQAAANRALVARPGYPAAMFNLALATVLGGDAPGSLAILNQLHAQQIEPGVDDLPEFAPLKALPGWGDYTAGSSALRDSVGNAEMRGGTTSAISYRKESLSLRTGTPRGSAAYATGRYAASATVPGRPPRLARTGACTACDCTPAGSGS